MKNLILKKQGKSIDNDELGLLYEEGNRYPYMSLSGELEYSLFQLTNDSNYLKLAYDELLTPPLAFRKYLIRNILNSPIQVL